ncbi:oxidoreductase [Rhodococcus rhodnii]|uniref:Vanillate O-demethylase oxidoreductase n=2 Tax=Rhodococcus rhodnii TaxID=38312 RepID=R7WSV1_9NOCA|nr:PDR/VanB family oxidoreductase [Rhodococcus rhodnii]EOM77239.1 vanillate O-demethylase oxidoreductase [Rhodococcus rhodnii LMG 5362]TXG90150.1 oxidoreductase [Rhodococcus rhodnii]
MRIPTELQVVAIDDVAVDVRTLEFATTDGTPFPEWEPGAHIALEVGEFRRQYSLIDGSGDRCRIAVLRDPHSRGGSEYLHTRVRVGDRLPLGSLANDFVFAPRPVTFVAGGIGITPILPMIDEALGRGLEVDLHYGGRDRAHMAFLDRITGLTGHPRFAAVVTGDDVDGPIDVAAALAARPDEDPVYCCGPAGLIDAVRGAANGRTVYSELFRADTDTAGAEFFVTIGERGDPIPVAAESTLLDTLRDRGYDLPSSCEEGTCGTCEIPVLRGDIDHRDHVLGESERRAGDTIIPCVSRAPGVLAIEL